MKKMKEMYTGHGVEVMKKMAEMGAAHGKEGKAAASPMERMAEAMNNMSPEELQAVMKRMMGGE